MHTALLPPPIFKTFIIEVFTTILSIAATISLISYNRRLQHACLIVDNYSSNSFACEFLSLLASTNLTQHVNLIWPLWHRHTSIPVLIISSFHLCQSR